MRNAFKLYLNDIGMLKEMASVTNESLVLDSERNLRKDGKFVNIPLYLAERYQACLGDV